MLDGRIVGENKINIDSIHIVVGKTDEEHKISCKVISTSTERIGGLYTRLAGHASSKLSAIVRYDLNSVPVGDQYGVIADKSMESVRDSIH